MIWDMVLVYTVAANILISLFSLVGVFTFGINEKRLHKWLMLLVGLSAGALMGGVVWHLLPEAIAEQGVEKALMVVLCSFVGFLILEKWLHWRHCHEHGECEEHTTFGTMNLIGDGVHNFIDGIVIAGAFSVDAKLGVVTAVAMALHEIPQEIGDYGVLIYSGWKRNAALLANLLVGLTAVLGGVFGWWLGEMSGEIVPYFVGIAAGGFLYIAATDLIPELRKQTETSPLLFSLSTFLAGLMMMYVFSLWE